MKKLLIFLFLFQFNLYAEKLEEFDLIKKLESKTQDLEIKIKELTEMNLIKYSSDLTFDKECNLSKETRDLRIKAIDTALEDIKSARSGIKQTATTSYKLNKTKFDYYDSDYEKMIINIAKDAKIKKGIVGPLFKLQYVTSNVIIKTLVKLANSYDPFTIKINGQEITGEKAVNLLIAEDLTDGALELMSLLSKEGKGDFYYTYEMSDTMVPALISIYIKKIETLKKNNPDKKIEEIISSEEFVKTSTDMIQKVEIIYILIKLRLELLKEYIQKEALLCSGAKLV
jgi:hypothetical protein